MPYITNDKRAVLDPAIDQLQKALVDLELDSDDNNTQGNLNYAITRLLRLVYGARYQDVNDAIGLLECIKQEYYRTVAAPYEDQKKFDNGDVDSDIQPTILNEVVVEDAEYESPHSVATKYD